VVNPTAGWNCHPTAQKKGNDELEKNGELKSKLEKDIQQTDSIYSCVTHLRFEVG
jgi:hypothetical protein